MTDDEIYGPWAGLYKRPPVPLSIRRHRNRARAIFVVLAVLAVVTGALIALPDLVARAL